MSSVKADTPTAHFYEDLAVERHRAAAHGEGVLYREASREHVRLAALTVCDEKKAGIGKPVGRYLSFAFPPLSENTAAERELCHLLASALFFFLGTQPLRLLVAGLGNRRLTADALGPLTADMVEATAVIPASAARAFGLTASRVFVFTPDVTAKTGIDSTRHTAALAALTEAEAVLTIDALASADRTRLLTVIELSDTGTVPGGGVGARPLPLSAKVLGIPVISIGVPTVVRAGTDHFTVLRRLEEELSAVSRVIAHAINRFAHPAHPPAPDLIATLFSKEEP